MRPDPKPDRRVRDAALLRQMHLELLNEPCERCEARVGVALHHKRFRSQGGDDSRENLSWLRPPVPRLPRPGPLLSAGIPGRSSFVVKYFPC